MVVAEHVVGVVGAGAPVAGIWDWSRGGKGVPWRREGTVFLCMLPRVPVQQVSYTLARERAYFPQNGVGGQRVALCVCVPHVPWGFEPYALRQRGLHSHPCVACQLDAPNRRVGKTRRSFLAYKRG